MGGMGLCLTSSMRSLSVSPLWVGYINRLPFALNAVTNFSFKSAYAAAPSLLTHSHPLPFLIVSVRDKKEARMTSNDKVWHGGTVCQWACSSQQPAHHEIRQCLTLQSAACQLLQALLPIYKTGIIILLFLASSL